MFESTDPATSVETASDSDQDLLHRYQTGGDRGALGELAQRYASMVYCSAHRRVGSSTLAEDVAQEVFMIFARRANTIRSAGAVGVWLMRATRYVSANILRAESRRRRREQAAHLQTQMISNPDSPHSEEPLWQEIAPLLDDALANLGRTDQTAVILRYFRGLTLLQVGQAIGVSEDGARKRVNRALDRLRKWLLRAGAPTACGATALAALLSGRAVQPAPAAILTHASHVALTTSAAKFSAASLLHSVAAMTPAAKAAIGIVAAGLLFSTGTAVYIVKKQTPPPVATLAAPIAAPAPPAAEPPSDLPPADWQENFHALYQLDDNQVVKHIELPFIPERQSFFDDEGQQRNRAPLHLQWTVFTIDSNGTLHDDVTGDEVTGGGNPSGLPGPDLAFLMPSVTLFPALRSMNAPQATRRQFHGWQVEGAPALLSLPVPGDWVVRRDADPVEILTGIVQAAGQSLHRNFILRREQGQRDVIVVSGQALRSTVTIKYPLGSGSNGDGPLCWVLDGMVNPVTGLRFWFDIKGAGPQTRFDFRGPPSKDLSPAEQQKQLLERLAAQTGLKFTPEKRTMDIWTITELPTTQP